ncbi:HU family DNA-binding protein [Sulfitobacter sp. BSw21498]|uniref:HU family DNA-binding protein n=1 Tax=Sulfitobacter sp. BSw21498 TaxID=664426 RepID=UPI0011103C9A|nr:HU family DNA-binding protein [Sulfitobacter sp. BSw21498]
MTTLNKTNTPNADIADDTATPAVVDAPHPVIMGPVMRKKELIDTVVERSGVKKRDAKPVVEAMLSVLGEALSDSRELNLLPFGKLKVINEKELKNGKMIRVKVRQVTPGQGDASAQDADVDLTDV